MFLLVRRWFSLTEFSLLANPFHIATAILVTTLALLLADNSRDLLQRSSFTIYTAAVVLVFIFSAFPTFVFQLAGLDMPGTLAIDVFIFLFNVFLGAVYVAYGYVVVLVVGGTRAKIS